MHLTSRQSKILKWVGYPLLAIVTFVFTLAYTFPYDRLKDKIIEGLNEKYDVSIMSVEPTLVPGTFVIETMVLRTRPKTPGEKPVIILIDEIEVDIGVMSAVLWSMDMAKIGIEVEAKVAGGSLDLSVEHDKGDNTLVLAAHTKMLPIASMPGVRDAVGLPMTGGLSADLNVTLPGGKWNKADGHVKFSCIGCTVGDGVAKMKMKPPPGAANSRRSQSRALFASDGLTVPRLNLGAVLGEIDIKKGSGEIKTFSARSKDGFLSMEGEIEFKDSFKETLFPGCMTFGFSDELKERSPKFMGIEAGLPPKAKQADGSYSIPTKGKLVELRFDVRRQCGSKSSGNDAVSRKRSRPEITTAAADKAAEIRKMPALGLIEEANAKKDDAGPEEKDESTESGPKLGRGFQDIKDRADVLNAKDEEAAGRDDDEAAEDEGEAEEDEDEGDSEDNEENGEEEVVDGPEDGDDGPAIE